MRCLLTDELWAVLGPHVAAKKYTCGSAPVLPDRMFFEAVLYWARSGVPWRDLPGEFGRWDAGYNRLRRWVYSGSLQVLFERLTADPQLGEVRRVRNAVRCWRNASTSASVMSERPRGHFLNPACPRGFRI